MVAPTPTTANGRLVLRGHPASCPQFGSRLVREGLPTTADILVRFSSPVQPPTTLFGPNTGQLAEDIEPKASGRPITPADSICFALGVLAA